MSQTSPLPSPLEYLQPFRKQFWPPKVEELNEDTGMVPLLELINGRMAGLAIEDATKLLEGDLTKLNGWLALPENANDPLHFVVGVVAVMSPAELVREAREAAAKEIDARPWVELELPPDGKPQRFADSGGIMVKCKELTFSVSIITADKMEREKKQLAAQNGPFAKVEQSPIQLGGVAGTKFTAITQNHFKRPQRSLNYYLTVPGGHVAVAVIFSGPKLNPKWDEAKKKEYAEMDRVNWDEKPIETALQSVRIETRPIAK